MCIARGDTVLEGGSVNFLEGKFDFSNIVVFDFSNIVVFDFSNILVFDFSNVHCFHNITCVHNEDASAFTFHPKLNYSMNCDEPLITIDTTR